MVYANDNWIQFPVKDIFDTAMMQMALNTAEKMYNKGEERMKEFKKDYSNFYSPNANDMKWYALNFSPEPLLQDLYNRGIDPLRSPEGRAAVAKWINSRPIGEFNARKQLAENIRTYLKNYAEIERLGKLDKNREAWELLQIPGFNGTSIADWDFSKHGMFDRLSPSVTNGLYGDTNPWFAKYKPEVIMRANKDENGNYVKDPNGMYDVIGVTEDRVKLALDTNLLDYISTGNGAWQYELSKRQLQSEGNLNPTLQLIVDRLKDNIVSANDSSLYKTEQINPDYRERQKHQFEMERQHDAQRFTAQQNAINMRNDNQNRAADRLLQLMLHGLDENGNPILINGDNSLAGLGSRKSNDKGIVHFSLAVGIEGVNNTLLKGVDTSGIAGVNDDAKVSDFYYKAASRTLDEKLKGLWAATFNVGHSKREADLVWNKPSTEKWNAISQNDTKFNNFVSSFIDSFSSDIATPETLALYISGISSQKLYGTHYAMPIQNGNNRLFTADLVMRNTQNMYSYESGYLPGTNTKNGRKTNTVNDEIKGYNTLLLYYLPTGRIVTIIDKQHRRCQYIEVHVTKNAGKTGVKDDKKMYFKMYNTTESRDVAGISIEGLNDNSRSQFVERLFYGASANVNSGGDAYISQ